MLCFTMLQQTRIYRKLINSRTILVFFYIFKKKSKRSLVSLSAGQLEEVNILRRKKIQFEYYYSVLLYYNCAGLSVRKQDKVRVSSPSLCVFDSVRG